MYENEICLINNFNISTFLPFKLVYFFKREGLVPLFLSRDFLTHRFIILISHDISLLIRWFYYYLTIIL